MFYSKHSDLLSIKPPNIFMQLNKYRQHFLSFPEEVVCIIMERMKNSSQQKDKIKKYGLLL